MTADNNHLKAVTMMQRMRCTPLGAPLVALIIIASWSVPAAAAGTQEGVKLAGRYGYVGGDGDVKALYSSVEGVVKKMNWAIRGIARRRLRKPNMPTAEISIAVDATTITVSRIGHSTVATPLSGAPVTWRSPDGTFQVTQVIEGRTLLQTLKGKDSQSTNAYTLGADGVTLSVHTDIVSRRLPAPVEFVMSYRKK